MLNKFNVPNKKVIISVGVFLLGVASYAFFLPEKEYEVSIQSQLSETVQKPVQDKFEKVKVGGAVGVGELVRERVISDADLNPDTSIFYESILEHVNADYVSGSAVIRVASLLDAFMRDMSVTRSEKITFFKKILSYSNTNVEVTAALVNMLSIHAPYELTEELLAYIDSEDVVIREAAFQAISMTYSQHNIRRSAQVLEEYDIQNVYDLMEAYSYSSKKGSGAYYHFSPIDLISQEFGQRLRAPKSNMEVEAVVTDIYDTLVMRREGDKTFVLEAIYNQLDELPTLVQNKLSIKLMGLKDDTVLADDVIKIINKILSGE